MISGQRVIKVFCHEEATKEEFDRRNEELQASATKANIFANILMPIMMNLGNLQYVLVAILGGALAVVSQESLITMGGIMLFLQLSKNFTRPVSQISQQVNSIIMALAGADRIFSLLDEPVEEDHGYVTLVRARENPDGTLTECKERTGTWAWKHPHQADGTITYTKLTGDVRLFDVDFAYEEGKTVLHDVSLYAKPGQKIAFVGATGAGKTTITNLINRFYDIADGKIRYDGININKIKKPDLRRSLGMVLQDVNLFTGTVMDNIRYGKLDATDEECIKAAKLANAHDFIMMLPQGYQDGALRRRLRPEPGPAAAAVHRPLRRGRSPGDDPGRGHLLHRHPHRGHRPAGHGSADEGQNRLCHRPPALHGPQLQRHHGPGARPHHRARRPRRPAGPEGHLLPALYRRLRARIIPPPRLRARCFFTPPKAQGRIPEGKAPLEGSCQPKAD